MNPVELKNLTTGYHTRRGEKIVSREVSASLAGGRLTCLLGPNGAGKSTLMRTLIGFSKPLGGDVEIMGRPIGSYSPADLSRLVGVVLTEKLMVSGMTVKELTAMGRAPYTGFWGRLTAHDNRIVERALQAVGVAGMAGRDISSLSDGERQKVMIAKALAQETPIILLDEPTAFLDYPSKVETMRLLHSLARNEKKTILLSTHDLELAMHTADRAWLIDRKLGIQTGTPEDLAFEGRLARYFNRPGIEFDMEEGIFKVTVATGGEAVTLRGSGPRRALTERALLRAGFAPGSTGPVIEVSEDSIILDNIKRFSSIGSLLEALESVTPR